MFAFLMEDMPKQVLPVEAASITLYRNALIGSDRIALYVKVNAAQRSVDVTLDGETHEVQFAPSFYTEWLEIPVSTLVSRGPDALDGYRMIYDEAREEELGFDQFPGAIYQNSHAGFRRATMGLTSTAQSTYAVEAEGETEFGWQFRLTAAAPLTQVVLRDGRDETNRAPDPMVEAEFETLFDPALFSTEWKRQGSGSHVWYDYTAVPKAPNP